MQVAVKCCKTVINMLKLADHNEPASDDMIPVMLYVLIQVTLLELITFYLHNFMKTKGQDKIV